MQHYFITSLSERLLLLLFVHLRNLMKNHLYEYLLIISSIMRCVTTSYCHHSDNDRICIRHYCKKNGCKVHCNNEGVIATHFLGSKYLQLR